MRKRAANFRPQNRSLIYALQQIMRDPASATELLEQAATRRAVPGRAGALNMQSQMAELARTGQLPFVTNPAAITRPQADTWRSLVNANPQKSIPAMPAARVPAELSDGDAGDVLRSLMSDLSNRAPTPTTAPQLSLLQRMRQHGGKVVGGALGLAGAARATQSLLSRNTPPMSPGAAAAPAPAPAVTPATPGATIPSSSFLQSALSHVQQNPMAYGLGALGIGGLLASLAPAGDDEQSYLYKTSELNAVFRKLAAGETLTPPKPQVFSNSTPMSTVRAATATRPASDYIKPTPPTIQAGGSGVGAGGMQPTPSYTPPYKPPLGPIKPQPVATAPSRATVNTLRSGGATTDPRTWLGGGLNLVNNFAGGVWGTGQGLVNGGANIMAAPLQGLSYAALGERSPTYQALRTFRDQTAEGAKAGFGNVPYMLSTTDGPTSSQLYAQKLQRATEMLPQEKFTLTDPTTYVTTAAQVVPRTLSAVPKTLQYAQGGVGDAINGVRRRAYTTLGYAAPKPLGDGGVNQWLGDYAKNLYDAKPTTLDETGHNLTFAMPVGRPIAAAKSLGITGRAGRALAQGGKAMQGAPVLSKMMRLGGIGVRNPGKVVGAGTRMLGNAAEAVTTTPTRVATNFVGRQIAKRSPTIGNTVQHVGDVVSNTIGRNVNTATRNMAVPTSLMAGYQLGQDPMRRPYMSQNPADGAAVVKDMMGLPDSTMGEMADVLNAAPNAENLTNGVMQELTKTTPSTESALPQQQLAMPQSNIANGFDASRGWDTKAVQSLTPEHVAGLKAEADSLMNTLPELPEDQQQPALQRIVTNKLAVWSRETGNDPTALMGKLTADGLQIDDLKTLTSNIQQQAQQNGQSMPSMQDAFAWFQNPETPGWQKLSMLIGLPMALMGLFSSMSGGDGGLFTLLGLGGMAAGAGLFGGGQQATAQQPPAAPAAPVDPQTAAASQSQLQGMLSDNRLDAAELKQLQAPEMQAYLAALPQDQIQPMIDAAVAGNPELGQQLTAGMNKYRTAKNSPFGFLAGDIDQQARDQISEQTGFSPEVAARLLPVLAAQ